MKSFAFILIISVMALLGCSESPPINWVEPSDRVVQLAFTDSIGLELGSDSNYVFGSVASASHSLSGNIMVLDMIKCTILEYSPEGDFIRQTGRHGDGPGELGMPFYMTLLSDGSITVADMTGAALVTYGPDRAFVDEKIFQQGLAPVSPVGSDSMSVIVLQLRLDPNDGTPLMVRRVCRLEGDMDAESEVYWSDSQPLDIQDYCKLYRDALNCCVFTADMEGRVFYTQFSTEEWHVTAVDRRGEMLFDIWLDLPSVPKSEREMVDESIYMESYIARTDDGLILDWKPLPNRYMITAIGVDGENRLWVQRGISDTPLFDVFDMNGVHLFTAELQGHETTGWKFSIDRYGILAYPEDSDLGQKVYTVDFV